MQNDRQGKENSESSENKEGLFLKYAIRKLLMEMRRSINTATMVDLIVAGLPEFIFNKIARVLIEYKVIKFLHMMEIVMYKRNIKM